MIAPKKPRVEGENPFEIFGTPGLISKRTVDTSGRTVATGPTLEPETSLGVGGAGEEENPFAIFTQVPVRQPEVGVAHPAGERFVHGVGRGIVHPVRAFLPGDQEPEVAPGVAGTIGEFVGMGLSFVPAFKVANVITKGVGLLKVAATGAETISFGGKILRGGISFAGFEAFAGETVSEAPKKAAEGFLVGAAFEAGIVGIAAAWRASRPAWRPATTLLELKPPTSPPDERSLVNPLALSIEYAMRINPKDTEPAIAAKLRELGNREQQLHVSLLKAMESHALGGNVIIPGLSQKDMVQLYKFANTADARLVGPFKTTAKGEPRFWFGANRRIKGEDLYDVWLVDKRRSIITPWWEGKNPTPEEMAKAIEQSFKNMGIESPDVIPSGKGTVLGDYHPGSSEASDPLLSSQFPRIRVATSQPGFRTAAGVSSLVHELTHHVSWVAARRRTGKPFLLKEANPTLDDIFALATPEELGGLGEWGKQRGTILHELQQATAYVVEWGLKLSDPTTKDFKLATDLAVQKNLKYFHADHELVARMGELILINPVLAKQIAPHASRLVGRLIQREAPKVRALMSKEARTTIDMFNDVWRMTNPEEGITAFTRGAPQVTAKHVAEFTRTGWAPGMRTLVNGRDFEFMGFEGIGALRKARLRNLSTGMIDTFDPSRVQRPVLQTLATRNEEIIRAVDGMLDSFPSSLPVNLAETIGLNAGVGSTREGVVDISKFLMLDGPITEWFKKLPSAVTDALTARFGQLNVPREVRELLGTGTTPVPGSSFYDAALAIKKQKDLIREALNLTGYKGIVRRDGGIVELFVADPTALTLSDIRNSASSAIVSGEASSGVLIPSLDDWLKQALREKGVAEVDLEYFMEITQARLGARLEKMKSLDVRQVEANVAAAKGAAKKGKKGKGKKPAPVGVKDTDIEPLGEPPAKYEYDPSVDTPEQTITRSGLIEDRLPDGRIELRDAQTKSVVARVADMDEAAAYARDTGIESTGADLVKFPGGSGDMGAGRPRKMNEPLIPSPSPIQSKSMGGSNLIDAHTLFAPIATALENFAKAAERRGFGEVYTRVYLPAHNAMLKVQRELAVIKRDGLGGLTFADKLREISDAMVSVSKSRYPTITGFVEALSKEEIEKAGGLMTRAMTAQELKAARFLEHVGLQNDVPRLMATDRLVSAALTGKLSTTVQRMKRLKISPEAKELLTKFESAPKFKTRDEVYDFLQLTQEEREVINNVVRASRGFKKDEYSIYAVSRHASAPKLKPGFKTGREMFAAENKMNDHELLISRLVDEGLTAAFEESGLDAKRHISGYWPHLRMWTQEGFAPDNRILPPEITKWVASRFRSGELNVYETDPLASVYKHIRGLYMARHFDPVVPEIRELLSKIKGLPGGRGVSNVMGEYMLELMGRPHASFESVQNALERVMVTLLGKKINPRFAQDVVNGLAAVTTSAFIPFRLALIVRNFFESLLKVAPRTGVSEYFKGLQYVVSPETRREAFEMAMNAGAIRPSTQRLRSLHSAEEMFGPQSPRALHRYLQVFDKGFSWYQSSDDWGRAIAYHAQRIRVSEHLDDFMKGKITMEQLRSLGKVNTFDPLDAAIFEREILNGNHQKAIDHLGQVLSRETMTRYGYADHPVGWNSVTGRLMGQFGTWPVQYKDYLLQGVSRGSWKDRAEFVGIHGAISGSIILAGASIGADLTNWTGMQVYTGGPYTDLAIDVMKSLSGSDLEKTLARSNIYANIPVLGWMETGNPRSMFIPGSYAIGDWNDAYTALQDDNVFKSMMEGFGLRVMRSTEKNPLDIF